MKVIKGVAKLLSFFIDGECYMVEAAYTGLMTTVGDIPYYQFKRTGDSGKTYMLSVAKVKECLQADLVECDEFTI